MSYLWRKCPSESEVDQTAIPDSGLCSVGHWTDGSVSMSLKFFLLGLLRAICPLSSWLSMGMGVGEGVAWIRRGR